MPKVSNERKNLTRLAGEFLVASRLAQRGYMLSLQWGTTISYDILAFDKLGAVAFIEVKTTASHRRSWLLPKKYAYPREDKIPVDKRYVCCVDMTGGLESPVVYVFPADLIAKGLHYFKGGRFSNSPSYDLALDSYPPGKRNETGAKTVSEFMNADSYIDAFDGLHLQPTLQ